MVETQFGCAPLFYSTIDGKYAARSNEWKLILNSTEAAKEDELYWIKNDPEEQHNLLKSNVSQANAFKNIIAHYRETLPDYSRNSDRFEPFVDAQTQEKIRKTGYW